MGCTLSEVVGDHAAGAHGSHYFVRTLDRLDHPPICMGITNGV